MGSEQAAADRALDYSKGISAGSSQQGQRLGSDGTYSAPHQYVTMMPHKNYGYSSKEATESNMANYGNVTSGIYEAASYGHFPVTRHIDPNAALFSSPPNSPLVGLVFDPNAPNYVGALQTGATEARNFASDQRTHASWMATNPDQILPIGSGARKKIMKTQPETRFYSDKQAHREVYYNKTENSNDNSIVKKRESNLVSESSTSLDFLAEGERMVSELCNVAEMSSGKDSDRSRGSKPYCFVVTKESSQESIETLLNCLNKIVIHDQIPNEIVQLAVEACTDAENIAIAHHNRPCFKNIHSICAKTRSNVQKADSAVANLHSQGIPWVIKNFIFSFVRILDGWKGVKELLCEKHDTFSRIENKYYSPNIRECFFQWQAVTKEMLTHIYKTFKCLDQGFTAEQRSFTHNYYSTNSAAPRHQNQSKFQQPKSGSNPSRPVSVSSQTYGGPTGHWQQNAPHSGNQSYSEPAWPFRSTAPCKKFPAIPPSHLYIYPSNDPTDSESSHPKSHFKYDPGFLREQKPRQSWTISNMNEFRASEGEQRQLYSHLKQSVDAELGSGSCAALSEAKSKMIPVSHVEKTLIPSMTSGGDSAASYLQKNNSGSNTKDETEIFTEWSKALQRESSQQRTQHKQNLQAVPFPSTIVGQLQLIDNENDEFHEQSKVYMKPGSYKVPIKPSDSINPLPQDSTIVYDTDEVGAGKTKGSIGSEMEPASSMYSMESWPVQTNMNCDFSEVLRQAVTHADIRGTLKECSNYVPCDPAWEAAKQSAPKLMDFICDGSKSDTARLYDALGFSTTTDDYCDEFTRLMNSVNRNEGVDASIGNNVSRIWSQQEKSNQINKYDNSDSNRKIIEHTDNINAIKRDDNTKNKTQSKTENDYGKTKNCIGKSKVAVSALWYQPKKHKPISKESSKMFEQIIANLSRMTESEFIQNDMDMKSAPLFYEVVKHPVCLTDISTKLKSCSYTNTEQVVNDFRRIFNNVRLYLKTYPDATMKKDVSKVSNEFEKLFSEELKNTESTQRDKAAFSEIGTSSKIEEKKTLGSPNDKSDSLKSDE